MEIPEEKKFEILMSQLHERYEALHKMRDRSMQFSLWILGFGLALAWLLINEIILTLGQRITITLILFIVLIITLIFERAIHRGFKHNRRIMINVENALKLYDKDAYSLEESVLPKKFGQQKVGLTGHFQTLYMLIISVFLLLIILTWTNPCKSKLIGSNNLSEPNAVQVEQNINN